MQYDIFHSSLTADHLAAAVASAIGRGHHGFRGRPVSSCYTRNSIVILSSQTHEHPGVRTNFKINKRYSHKFLFNCETACFCLKLIETSIFSVTSSFSCFYHRNICFSPHYFVAKNVKTRWGRGLISIGIAYLL